MSETNGDGDALQEDESAIYYLSITTTPLVKKQEVSNSGVTVHEGDSPNDIQVLQSNAVNPLVEYPHARFLCKAHPFSFSRISSEENQLHCSNCFCYICDVPVKECSEWIRHSYAHDKDDNDKLERAKNSLARKFGSAEVIVIDHHPRDSIAHKVVEPISFAELYSIYARISSSRELYEQLYQNDTTFIVPSKLRDKKDRGNLFNFSLGKRKQDLQDAATKKKQKGGDSRYEYVSLFSLGGPNEADGSIPCKVDSKLLEPFFGMTPGKMRELSKQDYDRAASLCNAASQNIVEDYSHLAPFRLKLFRSSQDYFSAALPSTDIEPVFLVVGRDS